MNPKVIYTSSYILKGVFLASLFLLVIISSITYRHTVTLKESSEEVVHSHKVNLELEELLSYIKDAETGQRGYIITHDTTFLIPFNNAYKNVSRSFNLLKELTADNIQQQKNLDSLKHLINMRFAFLEMGLQKDSVTPFNKSNKSALHINLLKGKDIMNIIRLHIKEMIDLEMRGLKGREQKYQSEVSFTPLFTFSLFLFSLLIFVLSYLMINRNFDILKKSNAQLTIITESFKQAEVIGEFCFTQWNSETNELYYSDNLYKLLGCKPKSFEPNNENYINFVHPEDKYIVNEEAEIMTKGGVIYPRFYRIIRKDGELRYFTSVGKFISNIENNRTYIGIIKDITQSYLDSENLEQKNRKLEEANAALLITTESFKHAEEIGKFSSWMWDLETNKLIYSDNQYRLLGCEPQCFEPTIENFLEFVHPDDKHVITQGNEQVMNEDKYPAAFFRIIRKDGKLHYFKSLSKILENIGGNKMLIGINSDVTEQHLNNVVLEDKNRELERTNTELASFNHVASHDLQEPLRKIQLFISRISEKDRGGMSEAGREYLEKIQVSAHRMRVLIDDLLLFSRTNKSEKVFEIADLNVLLENAQQELAETIEEKEAVIQAEPLPLLKVIPFQMQQLFLNLIGNALKYSQTGVSPVIKITCEKIIAQQYPVIKKDTLDYYYKISMSDNGVGFDQQYAENIFVLFQRLHDTNKYSGTGIGLAICKKIVENHGGFIIAEGQPEVGSVFTIFLPA